MKLRVLKCGISHRENIFSSDEAVTYLNGNFFLDLEGCGYSEDLNIGRFAIYYFSYSFYIFNFYSHFILPLSISLSLSLPFSLSISLSFLLSLFLSLPLPLQLV